MPGRGNRCAPISPWTPIGSFGYASAKPPRRRLSRPRRSVIAGSVTYGEGRQVRLTWPGGQQVVGVSGGRYRFEGLGAGAYRVAVLTVDVTLGEAAAREDITIDGMNEVAVDFVLSETYAY